MKNKKPRKPRSRLMTGIMAALAAVGIGFGVDQDPSNSIGGGSGVPMTYSTTQDAPFVQAGHFYVPTEIAFLSSINLRGEESLAEAFTDAVKSSNEKRVTTLITGGFKDKVENAQEIIDACLADAAAAGDVDMMKTLIADAKADVDGNYSAALRSAVSSGHADALKVLKDAGADLNANSGEAAQTVVGNQDHVSFDILRDGGVDLVTNGENLYRSANFNGDTYVLDILANLGIKDVVGGTPVSSPKPPPPPPQTI